MQPVDIFEKYEDTQRGGVNIYAPYRILEETGSFIHLAISKTQRSFIIFAYNLMPLVIIAMLIPLFYFNNNSIPIGLLALVSASFLALALILLYRKMIYEVRISDTDVEITATRHMRKFKQYVPYSEVDHIYLEVYRGRGGGGFFRLVTKTGIKVEFINIPYLFMKTENLRMIANRLREITGLHITGDNLALDGIL